MPIDKTMPPRSVIFACGIWNGWSGVKTLCTACVCRLSGLPNHYGVQFDHAPVNVMSLNMRRPLVTEQGTSLVTRSWVCPIYVTEFWAQIWYSRRTGRNDRSAALGISCSRSLRWGSLAEHFANGQHWLNTSINRWIFRKTCRQKVVHVKMDREILLGSFAKADNFWWQDVGETTESWEWRLGSQPFLEKKVHWFWNFQHIRVKQENRQDTLSENPESTKVTPKKSEKQPKSWCQQGDSVNADQTWEKNWLLTLIASFETLQNLSR